MLASADVDSIDPGITYYQFGWFITDATQRALYTYKPDDPLDPVPDLAEAPPDVSGDGRTVTVRLRENVRFSPPVNREVTSQDVKYAVERGFFKSVLNAYAGAYFADIAGAKTAAKAGTEIPGIETPDDRTVVFRLSRPTGGVLAGALALPLSAPVPKEYAARYDAETVSTYGAHHVATGPYMVANDARGRAVGYRAGRHIRLVRNPNWDEATDDRPAYLDEIEVKQGYDDIAFATRQVVRGRATISGDFGPDGGELRRLVVSKSPQLALTASGTTRYVALNTKLAPFDDAGVRRAVVAGFDRAALRAAFGGPVTGEIPTHIIPPGMPGFEEAGGRKGPGLDFLASESGDPQLAADYFRKAGHASGRYEGGEEIFMVGASGGSAQKIAEISRDELTKLGFEVRLRLVSLDAMYGKFCGVPKAEVAVCPNVAWGKDFADAQTMIAPTFKGSNIVPSGNVNYPQLDVPAIDEAMDEAEVLSDPDERARAWAEVDELVTSEAPVVPWLWAASVRVRAGDVRGVMNQYLGSWSLPYTSLL